MEAFMLKNLTIFFVLLTSLIFGLNYTYWEPNIPVSQEEEQAFNPRVVINQTTGRIVCVYYVGNNVGYAPTAYDIKVAYSDDLGESWINVSTPIDTDIPVSDTYFDLTDDLIIDTTLNNIIIAYKNNGHLYGSFSIDGGQTWSSPYEIDSSIASDYETGVFLSLNENSGYAIVSYRSGNIQKAAFATITNSNVTWATAEIIYGTSYGYFPKTSINELTGIALAVWNQGGNSTMASANKTGTVGAWSSPSTIQSGIYDNRGKYSPIMGLVVAGHSGFCVFRDNTSTILYSKYTTNDGSAWTASSIDPLSTSLNTLFYDWVAYNPTNNKSVVIFSEQVDGNYVLKSSVSSNLGQTWSTPVQITLPTEGVEMKNVNSVSYNETTGDIILIWQTSEDVIKAAYSNDGGSTWKFADASLSVLPSSYQRLAINSSNGQAVAVWQEGDYSSSTIKASIVVPFENITFPIKSMNVVRN